MGYELHITRGDDWSRRDKPEISLDEWQDFVAGRSDFELTGVAEATNPETDEVIRIEQPGIAIWRRESGPVWFSWWRGSIAVKSPDPDTIAEMVRIASSLNARVQGDDGEWYDEPPPQKRHWWKVW